MSAWKGIKIKSHCCRSNDSYGWVQPQAHRLADKRISKRTLGRSISYDCHTHLLVVTIKKKPEVVNFCIKINVIWEYARTSNESNVHQEYWCKKLSYIYSSMNWFHPKSNKIRFVLGVTSECQKNKETLWLIEKLTAKSPGSESDLERCPWLYQHK